MRYLFFRLAIFLKRPFSQYSRRKRLRVFLKEMKLTGGERIIDWVQTPSIYFPIEAHNHMPFWWFYPASVKRYFIGRWSKKLPAWTEMIIGTTVLDIEELKALFPDGLVYTEGVLGFIKSYSLYRR